MADARPCAARVYDGRMSHGCYREGVVEREGKRWCKQHDPEAVRERLAKRNARWDAERGQDDRTEAEGAAILKALGVRGRVDFNWMRTSGPRRMRFVVISFEDAKALAGRLKPR